MDDDGARGLREMAEPHLTTDGNNDGYDVDVRSTKRSGLRHVLAYFVVHSLASWLYRVRSVLYIFAISGTSGSSGFGSVSMEHIDSSTETTAANEQRFSHSVALPRDKPNPNRLGLGNETENTGNPAILKPVNPGLCAIENPGFDFGRQYYTENHTERLEMRNNIEIKAL
jgi:hypothetical protein